MHSTHRCQQDPLESTPVRWPSNAVSSLRLHCSKKHFILHFSSLPFQHLVDGNIFEVKTKNYPVTVNRLDVHMTASTAPIQVWYRPGNQSPSYMDTYENVLDTEITGNGLNAMTPLPAFTTPIVIPADSTYTFYVTTKTNGASTMYYEVGTLLGQAFASDEFLDINEGYAMRYAFSSPAYPRKWNGVFTLM